MNTPLEQEIQDKRLTAARVTLEMVEHAIVHDAYYTLEDAVFGKAAGNADSHTEVGCLAYATRPNLDQITLCHLELANGTRIVGINYGPISPENFDEELARKLAYQNAINQVYALLGYELRTQLQQRAELNQSSRPVGG